MLEDFFGVNIEVYELVRDDVGGETTDSEGTDEPHGRIVARKVRSTCSKAAGLGTMYVNLFGRHFSYIRNLSQYAQTWACGKCDKLFNHRFHATVHQRNCTAQTKLTFPGGGYGLAKNIFELLSENGVEIPDNLRLYPYRIAYDFEAICEQLSPEHDQPQQKHRFTAELIPASVSVCSNVPGFNRAKCFVSNGDPTAMLAEMYEYMAQISRSSYQLMLERFEDVVAAVAEHVNEFNRLEDEANEEQEAGNSKAAKRLRDDAYPLKIYDRLAKALDEWLRRIPALGFNSGKFDINLIRRYLFPYLLARKVPLMNIIKKCNDYMSVSTPDVLFLDMKNYLAAGTSYDNWLQSSDIPVSKGFFPYEWFTSLDKLNETQLPPMQAFWSNLKQTGISLENYEYLQRVWDEQGFRSMRDLLIWYNNLDVEPFIAASEKFFQLWAHQGIDPFKGGTISLPGLALTYMMKAITPHTVLPLFDDKTSDLYHLIRANIVGGLSVVMHRYHEADVTCLPNGAPCKWVFSHDCNALYLWALGEPTGTGIFALWRPLSDAGVSNREPWQPIPLEHPDHQDAAIAWEERKNHNLQQVFHKSFSCQTGRMELEWLEWTAEELGITIEHRFNGRQKVVPLTASIRYPVDGYHPNSNTVYQFHGCHWHGHECPLYNGGCTTEAHDRRQRTQEITCQLHQMGFTVVEKWECEWLEEKRNRQELRHFLNEHFNLPISARDLSGDHIVKAILDGRIFGLIECDIEVPRWNTALIDHFEEFPPICKNTNVGLADIGEFMREYAEENGYMRQQRRCLINSFWAEKILLTTPLVQWYLRHGLVITRVYQVIQMKPKACFADVRHSIAGHRRKADADPAYKPVGEAWKTSGNSTYGRAMTDKHKHKNTVVVPDGETSRYVNDKRFSRMEEVGDTAYEVSMDKKRINLDLPLTISFFVYNYAKMRMLEFVYDFLKRYLRPGSYQLVCSDTDSIMAAYESPDIDSLVRPELQAEYLAMAKPAYLVTDAFSLRTPGLFKEEWSGQGIIALCSKTYLTWTDDGARSKVSSKGLSRNNNFKREHYLRVLQTRRKGKGTNYGIRIVGDRLYQCAQEREGLAYLYIKRQVQPDGISTRALYL